MPELQLDVFNARIQSVAKVLSEQLWSHRQLPAILSGDEKSQEFINNCRATKLSVPQINKSLLLITFMFLIFIITNLLERNRIPIVLDRSVATYKHEVQ